LKGSKTLQAQDSKRARTNIRTSSTNLSRSRETVTNSLQVTRATTPDVNRETRARTQDKEPEIKVASEVEAEVAKETKAVKNSLNTMQETHTNEQLVL
jgi:hypothetical protein